MKKIAVIILIVAYTPFFFFNKGTLGGIFNSAYGILTALGIGLYILGDFMNNKKYYLVPLIVFFIILSLIFMLNTLIDGLYETYTPVLLTIITLNLCYIILAFSWHKYKQ